MPIHIILGASDFSKIKTGTCPRVGRIGETFAEQTKMGWVVTMCIKSREKVLSNEIMFLRKKIQPTLGVEVVKYVSLINGGKVLNGSKIKHNGLNN